MKLNRMLFLWVLLGFSAVLFLTGCDVDKKITFKPKKDIELSSMVEIINDVMFEEGFVLSTYARPERGQLIYGGGHSNKFSGVIFIGLQKNTEGIFSAKLNIQNPSIYQFDSYADEVLAKITKIVDSGDYTRYVGKSKDISTKKIVSESKK